MHRSMPMGERLVILPVVLRLEAALAGRSILIGRQIHCRAVQMKTNLVGNDGDERSILFSKTLERDLRAFGCNMNRIVVDKN